MFLFCFYTEDGIVVNSKGWNGSFWVDGTMVFAASVLVVNLKMAHKTNTHTWHSSLILMGSVLLFWLWLWAETALSAFPEVYKMHLLYSRNTYWILLLLCIFNYGQFILFYNLSVWLKIRQER